MALPYAFVGPGGSLRVSTGAFQTPTLRQVEAPAWMPR